MKQAIETFLERRRKNSNASLRAFAMEVNVNYETLKPFCRVDESKRKKFNGKGQTRLVPEVRFISLYFLPWTFSYSQLINSFTLHQRPTWILSVGEWYVSNLLLTVLKSSRLFRHSSSISTLVTRQRKY